MNITEQSKKKKLQGMIMAFFLVALAVYLYIEADIHSTRVQDELPVIKISKEGGL